MLGQTLSDVNCESFKYVSNAQSVFVKAVEQVLGNFSVNGIEASIEPNGVACDGTGSTAHLNILMEKDGQDKATRSYLKNALPSVHVEYLLSWVVASTDVTLLNSIYAAVIVALANAVSTTEFDSILQTIARQDNVTILISTTSPSFANLSSLMITILDQSKSPTFSPVIGAASSIVSGINGVAVEIVVSVIVVAVFVAVCLALLVYCHIYRKEIKGFQGCESYDVEVALPYSSSKQVDTNLKNDMTAGTNNYERSTMFSTQSSDAQRMKEERLSHFIGYGRESEGRCSQCDGRNSYNVSRFTINPYMRFNSMSSNHNNHNRQNSPALILIPNFEWTDIELKGATLAEAVIGRGSFGNVVQARLNARNEHDGGLVTCDDVVVKVMTKSLGIARDVNAYERNLNAAIQEVSILMDAESRIVFKDCIIKVYGIASGQLSQTLCETLNVSEETSVVGIVMRHERGGSLDALIHPKTSSSIHSSAALKINLKDKLRLLTAIARGLAELHTAGIVHGDIKPANVLLSSQDPTSAEVRLADFGLAAVKDRNSLIDSSLTETAHARGTVDTDTHIFLCALVC